MEDWFWPLCVIRLGHMQHRFHKVSQTFFQKNSTSKILARVFSASILTKQLHESHQIVMRRFKMTRPTKIFKKKHFMFVLSFRELMLIFAKVFTDLNIELDHLRSWSKLEFYGLSTKLCTNCSKFTLMPFQNWQFDVQKSLSDSTYLYVPLLSFKFKVM